MKDTQFDQNYIIEDYQQNEDIQDNINKIFKEGIDRFNRTLNRAIFLRESMKSFGKQQLIALFVGIYLLFDALVKSLITFQQTHFFNISTLVMFVFIIFYVYFIYAKQLYLRIVKDRTERDFLVDLSDIDQYYSNVKGSNFLLAKSKDKKQLCGFIGSQAENKAQYLFGDKLFKQDKQYIQILRLSVEYQERRKYVATTLLKEVLKKAKEDKFDFAYLTVLNLNHPALKLFQKAGFKTVKHLIFNRFFTIQVKVMILDLKEFDIPTGEVGQKQVKVQ